VLSPPTEATSKRISDRSPPRRVIDNALDEGGPVSLMRKRVPLPLPNVAPL
jgi:hypothetical protein